jgi:transposase-like protein
MRAPVLAVGDGALGFWGAIREVFPESKEQRCWVHYADLWIMPTNDLSRTQLALKRSA